MTAFFYFKYQNPTYYISDIDIILVGYPIWFHKPPMIVLDYLKLFGLDSVFDYIKLKEFESNNFDNIKDNLGLADYLSYGLF